MMASQNSTWTERNSPIFWTEMAWCWAKRTMMIRVRIEMLNKLVTKNMLVRYSLKDSVPPAWDFISFRLLIRRAADMIRSDNVTIICDKKM